MFPQDSYNTSELLKGQGFLVLAYCHENSSASENSSYGSPSSYIIGDMLVSKNGKIGIIHLQENDQIHYIVPAIYDEVYCHSGYPITSYDDFFDDYYRYLGRFAKKITDTLSIFDYYANGKLTTSFIAEKFEEEFYYRDNKVFSIYNDALTPYDDIRRITCERNTWDQACYGTDNCYLAYKNGLLWSLYSDTKDDKICYLKDYFCDNIALFGYFCFGKYFIVNIQGKQRLLLYVNGELQETGFIVDNIMPYGWCDRNNLYDPENCDESSAFILKSGEKYAILNPDGVTISPFIFDKVIGFISKDCLQVMQITGNMPLYGIYSLVDGLTTPCVLTEQAKDFQR